MDREARPTTSGFVKVGLNELYLNGKTLINSIGKWSFGFQIPNLHKAVNVVRNQNPLKVKTFFKLTLISLLGSVTFSCTDNNPHMKIDTAENLRKELKGVENEKITPTANIGELEMEVNNGGLNQYFFNSSGQNCFETLRLLKSKGKTKTAAILEEAIKAINPTHLSEKELIEKLRKREVDELNDDKVNAKLDSLDNEFFKYQHYLSSTKQ